MVHVQLCTGASLTSVHSQVNSFILHTPPELKNERESVAFTFGEVKETDSHSAS